MKLQLAFLPLLFAVALPSSIPVSGQAAVAAADRRLSLPIYQSGGRQLADHPVYGNSRGLLRDERNLDSQSVKRPSASARGLSSTNGDGIFFGDRRLARQKQAAAPARVLSSQGAPFHPLRVLSSQGVVLKGSPRALSSKSNGGGGLGIVLGDRRLAKKPLKAHAAARVE